MRTFVHTSTWTARAPLHHAIVLGGSVAGLLAARVLSDHFERVTLIERDELMRRLVLFNCIYLLFVFYLDLPRPIFDTTRRSRTWRSRAEVSRPAGFLLPYHPHLYLSRLVAGPCPSIGSSDNTTPTLHRQRDGILLSSVSYCEIKSLDFGTKPSLESFGVSTVIAPLVQSLPHVIV